MAKKINNNPFDFEEIIVNGCLIEPNTTYEIVSREPRADDPDVYKQLGSVKEKHPHVSNSLYLSQQDTGFYAGSPVFNESSIKSDWNKREELASKYYETFAEPLRHYISDIEKIRVPTENEFFDKFYETKYCKVKLREGLQLNTSNPVERFQLYIAIIEGALVMKGKREDYEKKEGMKDELSLNNSDSQYAYISVTERKNRNEQNAELTLELNYKFMNLIKSNKGTLIDILNYISIPVSQTASNGELANIFTNTISNNKTKAVQFMTEVERLEAAGDSFEKELDIINKLKTKKGREIIYKQGSAYYMNEKPMGSNYKSVAAALLKDQELLREFYSVFQA